ncbi:MAG: HK97 family phage prohead protease [Sphingomonas sp.]|uniref:HK97 family phage prohead protease n=2 Tax=Sphingomonas adhaesiva TaxID=28212 RepID=A0A2A4I6A0_9SPHN|nr:MULTISPECIES: HK97 family phage prohead protease [Sphingomonas]PCG14527.1 HK97 family phage prohead protease [Sphingomonas adhaesiva]PZU75265.1 MAG: HK97 family phage prohead protease [Sphingomonas sp.]
MRIAGYAAVYDRVDRAGDVFRAGAFAGAVPVPLLLHHRGAAVGAVLALGEDERGLRIAARIDDPAVARAVRSGALPALSVGYRARRVTQGAWREIRAADLAEISLVAVPMQPAARIAAIDDD